MLNSVYPGQCGYKSYTGGAMSNLRKLQVEKGFPQYHPFFKLC